MQDREPATLPLVGREAEMQALDDHLDGINEHGAALLVRGEVGIGKSSLLTYASARARARGTLTLRVIGVQSEAHLPFAGIHQLLRPILAGLSELPDPQRDALLAAFGLIAAPAPDFFLIAMAALDLLAGAAARAPILILVDDVQWLDQSTCDALAFIAHRLESEPIVLLLALRDGFESALTGANLPALHLGGLAPVAAAALLDARAPDLAASVRERLLADAAGNPLALVELPVALTAEQLGGAPLPDMLPLTARLERAFGARVMLLPELTRTLLLVAALDDGGTVAEVLRTTVQLVQEQATEDSLEPAIRAGLITLDERDHTIAFRHPLVRSAVAQAAAGSRRRTAHAAWASALAHAPDRSIWHLAASRISPDLEVATALEAAATRAESRGANAVAVEALERAAHFTASPRLRGELLVRAAELAFELGRRDRGMHLLHQAESLDLAPRERTFLLWYKETYGSAQGWSDTTRLRAFVELADQSIAEGDVGLALRILMRSVLRCYWGNPDQQTRERFLATAERILVPDDDPTLVKIHALVAPIERGATVIERIARLSSPGASDDPEMAYHLSTAASAVGDFVPSARLAALAIEGLRLQARLGLVAQLLLTQAFTTFYLGSWDVATPAAAEADRLARETGQDLWATVARLVAAMVAAVRGEHALAEALTADAERELVPLGANPFLCLVQHARGCIALAGGRYAAAFAHLHRMFVPTESAYHPVVRCWAIADLVEAAVRSGHHGEARATMADLETLAAEAKFPYLRASLTYVRPMLAEDADAEPLFQEALAADLTHWPFLRGRLQLAYGSWLRRQRRAAESRASLRAAREAFDALGALAWGERARQELRASGETSRRRVPEARDRLSPQELQIAQMAAAGLSNREIGRRLFVSHRTVGSHLYHLFPKLGITSRAELRAALGIVASGE